MINCPYCDGKGKYILKSETDMFGEIVYPAKCYECDGSGKLDEDTIESD